MANGEIKLVHFAAQEPDLPRAMWFGLGSGEMIAINGVGSTIVVRKAQKNQRAFMIEKQVGDAPAPKTDYVAEEWNHGKDTTVLTAGSTSFTGILLGPSMVGSEIYGGQLPSGDGMRERYGIVFPHFDDDDGMWGVSLVMPNLPYRDLESVIVRENQP